MRRSIKTLALALAVAGLALLPAAAQGPHGHGHGGPGGYGGPGGPGMPEHLTRVLDLSTEQQAQVKTVFAKYTEGTMGEKARAVRDARGTLAQTIHNPEATDQQVQDAAAAVSTLEAQLAVEQHHMVLEILAFLTAEQRVKFTDFANSHHGPPRWLPPPPPESGS